MGAPPPELTRRRRWGLVSLAVVIACAVIVAAVVVLRMMPDLPPPGLQVVLGSPQTSPGGYRINVTSSSVQASITALAANLEVNGSFGHPLAFPGANPYTVVLDVSNTSYAVTWKDANSDGWFDGGDYFLVVSAYGLPPGTSFSLLLLGAAEGHLLAQASWVTS